MFHSILRRKDVLYLSVSTEPVKRMTAEDWTLSEAEQARKETADAAGLTVEEVASRRALPCPNGTTRAGPVRGRASSTRPWGRAMTDARRPQMEVLPVARVADGDDPEHELRAELRMARELLAVREARSGQGQPPAPPANKITPPTHPARRCTTPRPHRPPRTGPRRRAAWV